MFYTYHRKQGVTRPRVPQARHHYKNLVITAAYNPNNNDDNDDDDDEDNDIEQLPWLWKYFPPYI